MNLGNFFDPFGAVRGTAKGLKSFFNPSQGYQDAGNTLQQYYDRAQGQIGEPMGRLLDPVGLQSEWVDSYEQSPYAQQLLRQSKEQGMNLAQSMGLGGSSAALRGMTQEAGNIINQDRQNYLNDLMQKYMGGASLAGQASNQTMGMGGDMAGLSYGQTQGFGNTIAQLLPLLVGAISGRGG